MTILSSEQFWEAFAGEDITVWFDGPEDPRFIGAIDRVIQLLLPVAVEEARKGFEEAIRSQGNQLMGTNSVTLSVATEDQAMRAGAFQALATLANELEQNFPGLLSVSVSAYNLGDPEPSGEGYDENTMFKVHDAIVSAGVTSAQARDIINAMQNSGIVFRERF